MGSTIWHLLSPWSAVAPEIMIPGIKHEPWVQKLSLNAQLVSGLSCVASGPLHLLFSLPEPTSYSWLLPSLNVSSSEKPAQAASHRVSTLFTSATLGPFVISQLFCLPFVLWRQGLGLMWAPVMEAFEDLGRPHTHGSEFSSVKQEN
jgi:hypothetical protein